MRDKDLRIKELEIIGEKMYVWRRQRNDGKRAWSSGYQKEKLKLEDIRDLMNNRSK